MKILRYIFSALVVSLCIYGFTATVSAVDQLPAAQGTMGMQGTIPSPPPTTPATISVPGNGQTFTQTPITVSGLCSANTIVKIFSNDIFVGSAPCENGSYKIQIDLFGGTNAIVARIFDTLDQAGPDSNKVTVTFQDSQFTQSVERVMLTSSYARMGAPVGQKLTWPITISGGRGPFALSIDWGDGSSADLKSVSFAGTIDMPHTYKTAGIFKVVVKVTDANGSVGYLQLVGVGNGAASQSDSGKGSGGSVETRRVYIWWPVLLLLPFALVAFWVGRRYEVVSIHRKLEQQASMYSNEIQR